MINSLVSRIKNIPLKYLYIGSVAVVLLTSLVIYFLVFRSKNTFVSPIGTPATQLIPQKINPTLPLADAPKTLGILLLGHGGAGHDGGFLTDAIQLLYIDMDKQKTVLISIPRDLQVPSPKGRSVKINAIALDNATDRKAIMKSGSPALKQVITTVTGLPVHFFVSVDFVGLQRAVGIDLKGIDVNVSETLEDNWYPKQGAELETCGMSPEEVAEVSKKYSGFELEKQFPCRYEHLLYKKGLVHMEGGDVLKYMRSRHGSGEGDVARGKRQQEVLQAVVKKVFTLKTIQDIPQLFTQLSKYTASDIDVSIINKLLPLFSSAKQFQVKTINLAPTNVLMSSSSQTNGYIMIPKSGDNTWNDVHTYIQNEINK